MEPITHLNITIEGVTYNRILGLEINHSVNEHATAVISVETEEETAKDYISRTDEKTAVRILTTAEGQASAQGGVLFHGVVSNVGVELMKEYAILRLVLSSSSVLTDTQKKNKSYQNTNKTYEDILTQALGGMATVDMQVSDKAIGKMIVQCNETDWEFCKRMASRLGAPVITSIDADVPVFTIGIPQSGKSYNLDHAESKVQSFQNQVEDMMVEDKLGTNIKTTQYMFLGDTAMYGENGQRVKGIHATLVSGMLVTTVSLGRETGFVQPTVANNMIAGRMYTGTVEDVSGDKVKVHLTDIDSEFDTESTVWLPYSTAYSSNDGSGFYCMPAVKDTVRVFFPGSDEGEAFAASSVSVNVGEKVTDKQWTGPNGKQILLTENGIYITTNATESGDERKIFIDLTDDSGIKIKCNNDINICAKNNLSLISNNNIFITADNDILLSTAEAFIDINKNGIEMGGENIVIK